MKKIVIVNIEQFETKVGNTLEDVLLQENYKRLGKAYKWRK